MKRSSLLLGLFGLLAIPSLLSTSAYAQGRTYVSAVSGSDGHDCSRATPCATFSRAHGLTHIGGEIICLDSGSFGSVTITRSITIDCAATRSFINLSTGTGITVNAGPLDKVIIRNLHLAGLRQSSGNEIGYDGILFQAGGELEVDNVFIAGVGPLFAGINVEKTAFGVLTVRNSTFSRMDFGIKMQATSGSISASIASSSFNNLANTGIEVGKGTYVTVSDSKFTAIYGYGIKSATSTSYASATNNVFSSSYIGMSANVAGAKINATGNQFFGNSKAFNVAAGGVFFSGNGNAIDVNPGNPPTGALTYR